MAKTMKEMPVIGVWPKEKFKIDHLAAAAEFPSSLKFVAVNGS
jgi:hypothetical protein